MSRVSRCVDCQNDAHWYVWYEDCVIAVGPEAMPANIAYHCLCDDCTFKMMRQGRGGYAVACVKPVPARFRRAEP